MDETEEWTCSCGNLNPSSLKRFKKPCYKWKPGYRKRGTAKKTKAPAAAAVSIKAKNVNPSTDTISNIRETAGEALHGSIDEGPKRSAPRSKNSKSSAAPASSLLISAPTGAVSRKGKNVNPSIDMISNIRETAGEALQGSIDEGPKRSAPRSKHLKSSAALAFSLPISFNSFNPNAKTNSTNSNSCETLSMGEDVITNEGSEKYSRVTRLDQIKIRLEEIRILKGNLIGSIERNEGLKSTSDLSSAHEGHRSTSDMSSAHKGPRSTSFTYRAKYTKDKAYDQHYLPTLAEPLKKMKTA